MCDSANAQASKWVQEEMRYIKEKKKRYCETVNLDTISIEQVNAQLQKFEQRSTVTILYSGDREKGLKPVAEELLTYDMKVKVGKLEDLMKEGDPIEVLGELAEVGFVVMMPGANILSSFINGFLHISDALCKRIIVLNDKQNASLIDTILYRIEDYRELMDWSTRVYGDARVRLIEEAVYHGGSPTLQILLASIYEKGLYGVDIDYEKALEWLNAARYEDGLAVNYQIERIEEKLKQQSQNI